MLNEMTILKDTTAHLGLYITGELQWFDTFMKEKLNALPSSDYELKQSVM